MKKFPQDNKKTTYGMQENHQRDLSQSDLQHTEQKKTS